MNHKTNLTLSVDCPHCGHLIRIEIVKGEDTLPKRRWVRPHCRTVGNKKKHEVWVNGYYTNKGGR